MPMVHEQRLRIAFALDHIVSPTWTGGAHYLKNLFVALRSLEADIQPEIVLLVSRHKPASAYRHLIDFADEVLYAPIRYSMGRFLARRAGRFAGSLDKGFSIGAFLRKRRVELVFSMDSFGPQFSVPLLGWIPDFQHLHLPEMFPPEEVEARNHNILRIAHSARRVILSSHAAFGDFRDFAPQFATKGALLPFVAQVPPGTFDTDPGWVCDMYNLPRRYIYLPNQFWKHKNHRLVIEALRLLKHEYPEIVVVCTGNTADPRNPDHFASLKAAIARHGLRDNIIILGLIPYSHVFPLMRQSLAVLQPSLFEGWSTTVEEAKSVGKPMLLSDIPVHREQAQHQVGAAADLLRMTRGS